MSVLFPAPFGPAMPSTSPALTVSVSSSSARTFRPRSGEWYVLPRSTNSITRAPRRGSPSARRGRGDRRRARIGARGRVGVAGDRSGRARAPRSLSGALQPRRRLLAPSQSIQRAAEEALRRLVVGLRLDGADVELARQLV